MLLDALMRITASCAGELVEIDLDIRAVKINGDAEQVALGITSWVSVKENPRKIPQSILNRSRLIVLVFRERGKFED